jgi:hypothetical protein
MAAFVPVALIVLTAAAVVLRSVATCAGAPGAQPLSPTSIRSQTLPPETLAAQVGRYVNGTLARRVAVAEDALMAANQAVHPYCAAHAPGTTLCFAGTVDFLDPRVQTMGMVFQHQALLLSATSQELALQLGAFQPGNPLVAAHVHALVEDLSLSSVQLASVLQDHAQVIAQMARLPVQPPGAGATLRELGYAGRVYAVTTLLQRAQSWLETINHETGAHAVVPGFGPGEPPLVQQFGLQ